MSRRYEAAPRDGAAGTKRGREEPAAVVEGSILGESDPGEHFAQREITAAHTADLMPSGPAARKYPRLAEGGVRARAHTRVCCRAMPPAFLGGYILRVAGGWRWWRRA